MRHSTPAPLLVLAAVVALAAGCGGDAPASVTGAPVETLPPPVTTARFSPAPVYQWNARTEFFALLAGDEREPVAATHEALIYALVNGAMHDVVNAITPRYRPFAYNFAFVARSVDDFHPEAAIGTAAFTVLEAIGLRLAADKESPNPYPLAFIRREYSNAMLRILDTPAKAAGMALGRDVAVALLAARSFEWVENRGLTAYVSSGEPGAYRPTAPYTSGEGGTTGFAGWTRWAATRAFTLQFAAQFRAPPPYDAPRLSDAVRTAEYAADLAEVQRLGGVDSQRSPEQTEIAFFWAENPALAWQRIARIQGIAHQFDVWDIARLLALVAFAQADANIVAYDTKYAFPFWRPVTAIRQADADGNAATVADARWEVASSPFGYPTPPTPEYASAHAIAGSAAATILTALVSGSTAFTMTSTVLPELERSFESVGAAAKENLDSRVFLGYHFRQSVKVGELQGTRLGQWVLANALPRVR